MSKESKFAKMILNRYAKECGAIQRSTSDISPLEEWLILQLFNAAKDKANGDKNYFEYYFDTVEEFKNYFKIPNK